MKLSELKRLSHSLSIHDPGIAASRLHDELIKMGIDPGNFYQELEMDSPFVDTHRDISYSNTNIHFHSHAFYELLCCRNNCDAEYLVNTERYKLQKGDIIFVPPGVSHSPLLPETVLQPYEQYCSHALQYESGAVFQARCVPQCRYPVGIYLRSVS